MSELLRVQKIKDSALRVIRRTVNKKNYLQVLVNYLITYDCSFYSEVLFLICGCWEESR